MDDILVFYIILASTAFGVLCCIFLCYYMYSRTERQDDYTIQHLPVPLVSDLNEASRTKSSNQWYSNYTSIHSEQPYQFLQSPNQPNIVII